MRVYSLGGYRLGGDSLGVILPQTVAHEQAQINKNTDSFACRHSQIHNAVILACFLSWHIHKGHVDTKYVNKPPAKLGSLMCIAAAKCDILHGRKKPYNIQP